MNRKFVNKFEFLIFIIPVIILISVTIYIPFFMSTFYSLTKWNGIDKKPTFIGLKNFYQIFTGDDNFRDAAIFTIKYTIIFIVLVNVIALLLAIFLDKKLKTVNILRAAFFVPYILSLVIVGFIWKFIFSQGFASLFEITGFSVFNLSWLGTSQLAFISIIFVSIWQSVGFYIVIYIAGLQAIPNELLEASTVDGAGPIKKFFRITFPLLAPSVTTCFFMALTNSIKVFDVIISLTAGGPGGSTYSVTLDIYREAFQNNLYGYGSAKALILFIVVLIITFFQLKFLKSREVEV